PVEGARRRRDRPSPPPAPQGVGLRGARLRSHGRLGVACVRGRPDREGDHPPRHARRRRGVVGAPPREPEAPGPRGGAARAARDERSDRLIARAVPRPSTAHLSRPGYWRVAIVKGSTSSSVRTFTAIIGPVGPTPRAKGRIPHVLQKRWWITFLLNW